LRQTIILSANPKKLGGSGLIFWGSGGARVEGFRLGLLKFKIGLEAFKSWAHITGLKICKNL
jgi:hypothetical protein